ncbi:MAG: hypothetical protein ACRBFS_00690 [Aureispira sp.]
MPTTFITAQGDISDNLYERHVYIETDTIKYMKQFIYCERTIRWAGIVDVDIIPHQKSNQSWDNFKESGFSNLNFKQYTTDTSLIDTSLIQYIINGIQNNKVPVFQTDSLSSFKDVEESAFYALTPSGKDIHHYYDANDFEIIRLRCFLFYVENNNGFELVPVAAAPIRTEYDSYTRTAQPSYLPLGWIDVTTNTPKNKPWHKQVHSDINLNNIHVFKQDWTFDQSIQNLIEDHQAPNSTSKLYDAKSFQNSSQLSIQQLEELITYEEISFDPETFEQITIPVPYENLGLVGLNISIELVWDNLNHKLHIKPIQFSPIAHQMEIYCNDCAGQNMHLYHLFSNKK